MKRAVLECVKCGCKMHAAIHEPIPSNILHIGAETLPALHAVEEIHLSEILVINEALRAQVSYLQKCLLALNKKKKRQ